MVLSRSPEASNTDTVWVYIMFWAKTSPLLEASTDFGDICPVIRRTRSMRVSADGVLGTAVVFGGLVCVAVGCLVAAATGRWSAAAGSEGAGPPNSRETPKDTSASSATIPTRAARRRRAY